MSTSTAPQVWLDHVVVGIDDLDRGIASFEAMTGVRPQYCGEHPALGTHNALASLGPGRYLEILAARPGASVDERFADVVGCTTLTPVMWALATDNVNEIQRRITAAGFNADAPAPGSRVTPDGDTVRWSMFMMQDGLPANAPFFTGWEPTTRHPSATSPEGCSAGDLSVSSPDAAELERLLDTIGFSMSVGPGQKGLAMLLDTPKGAVKLGA